MLKPQKAAARNIFTFMCCRRHTYSQTMPVTNTTECLFSMQVATLKGKLQYSHNVCESVWKKKEIRLCGIFIFHFRVCTRAHALCTSVRRSFLAAWVPFSWSMNADSSLIFFFFVFYRPASSSFIFSYYTDWSNSTAFSFCFRMRRSGWHSTRKMREVFFLFIRFCAFLAVEIIFFFCSFFVGVEFSYALCLYFIDRFSSWLGFFFSFVRLLFWKMEDLLWKDFFLSFLKKLEKIWKETFGKNQKKFVVI